MILLVVTREARGSSGWQPIGNWVIGWMSNNILFSYMDVIIYPCPSPDAGSVNLFF